MFPVQINYDNVVKDARFTSITKMTAISLQNNPYMTLGDFFTRLSVNDVTTLSLLVEVATKGDDNAFSELLMLAEMLARAEGTESSSLQESTDNFNYFCSLIAAVSLNRKGLVDISYENLSFGRDMGDKEIIKLR